MVMISKQKISYIGHNRVSFTAPDGTKAKRKIRQSLHSGPYVLYNNKRTYLGITIEWFIWQKLREEAQHTEYCMLV